MKIEISEAFPEHFRPAYPEEFELFSHFETTAGIPSPLFAITTWKENGLPNVCFHAWSCFHGDRTAFFAVMGNLYQHTHTYANILREKCFALNFLPIACYDRLVETIQMCIRDRGQPAWRRESCHGACSWTRTASGQRGSMGR